MTWREALCVALAVATLGACGKYGPPRRMGQPPPQQQSVQPSPIPPLPTAPEGTGILNPTSEPLPPPTAPSQEPEVYTDDPEEELEP